MYYYSNTLTKAKEETLLTIDTRGSKPRPQVTSPEDNEEAEEDGSIEPMEKAILYPQLSLLCQLIEQRSPSITLSVTEFKSKLTL